MPQFWEMPSPQPSPTGEGADCSEFKRCRPSEKECPKYQQREFFRHPLSQGRWNKRRERFFQTVFEPIGRVCTARHARGGLWLQRKWRTRACVPHTPYISVLKFVPPAGRVSGVATHAVSRDSGYGLLRHIKGNTIEKKDISSNFQFVAWAMPAKI